MAHFEQLTIDAPFISAPDEDAIRYFGEPSDSSLRPTMSDALAGGPKRRTAHGWRFWAKAKALWFITLQPRVWKQLQRSPVLDPDKLDEGSTSENSSFRSVSASPISPSHREYLSKLKAGVHSGLWTQGGGQSALGSLLMASSVKKAEALAQHAFASGKIVTEVSADASAVEFWRQGDASLSTAEALRQRFALRTEPRVVGALQHFWEAALRSIQSSGDVSAHTLSFEGYSKLLLRVYRVLMEEWDAEDADQCIQDDWKNDAKGRDELGREGFMDALFELADTWCKTINAEEYISFLNDLFERVTMQVDGKTYIWKDENDVHFHDYTVDGSLHDPRDGEEQLPSISPESRGGGYEPPSPRRQRSRKAKKRHVAAQKINGAVRGRLARNQKVQRERSAAKITAVGRGHVARKEAKRLKSANSSFITKRPPEILGPMADPYGGKEAAYGPNFCAVIPAGSLGWDGPSMLDTHGSYDPNDPNKQYKPFWQPSMGGSWEAITGGLGGSDGVLDGSLAGEAFLAGGSSSFYGIDGPDVDGTGVGTERGGEGPNLTGVKGKKQAWALRSSKHFKTNSKLLPPPPVGSAQQAAAEEASMVREMRIRQAQMAKMGKRAGPHQARSVPLSGLGPVWQTDSKTPTVARSTSTGEAPASVKANQKGAPMGASQRGGVRVAHERDTRTHERDTRTRAVAGDPLASAKEALGAQRGTDSRPGAVQAAVRVSTPHRHEPASGRLSERKGRAPSHDELVRLQQRRAGAVAEAAEDDEVLAKARVAAAHAARTCSGLASDGGGTGAPDAAATSLACLSDNAQPLGQDGHGDGETLAGSLGSTTVPLGATVPRTPPWNPVSAAGAGAGTAGAPWGAPGAAPGGLPRASHHAPQSDLRPCSAPPGVPPIPIPPQMADDDDDFSRPPRNAKFSPRASWEPPHPPPPTAPNSRQLSRRESYEPLTPYCYPQEGSSSPAAGRYTGRPQSAPSFGDIKMPTSHVDLWPRNFAKPSSMTALSSFDPPWKRHAEGSLPLMANVEEHAAYASPSLYYAAACDASSAVRTAAVLSNSLAPQIRSAQGGTTLRASHSAANTTSRLREEWRQGFDGLAVAPPPPHWPGRGSRGGASRGGFEERHRVAASTSPSPQSHAARYTGADDAKRVASRVYPRARHTPAGGSVAGHRGHVFRPAIERRTGLSRPPSAPSLLQHSHPPIIAGGARRTEPRKHTLDVTPMLGRKAADNERHVLDFAGERFEAAYRKIESTRRYQMKIAAMHRIPAHSPLDQQQQLTQRIWSAV